MFNSPAFRQSLGNKNYTDLVAPVSFATVHLPGKTIPDLSSLAPSPESSSE
jgi:hypothetical protein